jgi:ABC-2 type transport system ATP-binding protein
VQIVEMRELVRSLRGDHTVVLSSHILSEISETCDRILVIDDGEITWSGSENELATELKQGIRVGLTVRVPNAAGDAASARAREIIAKIEGVREVEIVDPSEAGEGVASLRVMAGSDVRDGMCRALVEAGLGILQVGRERELESMVLELLGEGGEGGARKKKRRGAGAVSAESAEPVADRPESDEKAESAAKSEAEA